MSPPLSPGGDVERRIIYFYFILFYLIFISGSVLNSSCGCEVDKRSLCIQGLRVISSLLGIYCYSYPATYLPASTYFILHSPRTPVTPYPFPSLPLRSVRISHTSTLAYSFYATRIHIIPLNTVISQVLSIYPGTTPVHSASE